MIDEIVDLFAGPGGWSEALKALGHSDLGIEYDAAACATRAAAGHRTIQADIAELDPADYIDVRGLIASPPCVWLIIDLGRWLASTSAEWIALEQVPAVAPIWHAYAGLLTTRGYSTWTGILNAADYGVPQTRRRAILIASRTRHVHPPEPTHDATPVDSLFGTLERWVTMAEALGWTGDFRIGFPCLDDTGTAEDGYRDRDWRSGDELAHVLTEKARSWKVEYRRGGDRIHEGIDPDEQPAETVTTRADRWQVNTGRDWKAGGTRDDAQTFDATEQPAPTVDGKGRWHAWPEDRPATTLMGDPRVSAPGGHTAYDGRDNTKSHGRMEGAIRLTIRDALILQSFRPDYPVAGTKTKQFEQVGNAIPPLLARRILESVIHQVVI